MKKKITNDGGGCERLSKTRLTLTNRGMCLSVCMWEWAVNGLNVNKIRFNTIISFYNEKCEFRCLQLLFSRTLYFSRCSHLSASFG